MESMWLSNAPKPEVDTLSNPPCDKHTTNHRELPGKCTSNCGSLVPRPPLTTTTTTAAAAATVTHNVLQIRQHQRLAQATCVQTRGLGIQVNALHQRLRPGDPANAEACVESHTPQQVMRKNKEEEDTLHSQRPPQSERHSTAPQQ